MCYRSIGALFEIYHIITVDECVRIFHGSDTFPYVISSHIAELMAATGGHTCFGRLCNHCDLAKSHYLLIEHFNRVAKEAENVNLF